MLCDYCHGKRLVVAYGRVQPCTECGGLGVLHCCEGLQAQPETPAVAPTGHSFSPPEARSRRACGQLPILVTRGG